MAEGLEERELIYLFHTDTVLQVGSIFDAPFWTAEVPRATHVYPTIWHASLALAAIHKRYISIENLGGDKHYEDRYYKLALEHYGDAMNRLLQIVQQDNICHGDKETLLLSTVLFTGICRLQENLPEALAHIRNGLKMFRLWRMWETTPEGAVLSIRSLVALFSQFQQFLELQGDVSDSEWLVGGILPSSATEQFSSIRQAYLEFEHLQISILGDLPEGSKRRSTEIGLSVHEPQAPVYFSALDLWGMKLSELEKTQQPDSIDIELAMLLSLRLSCAKMKLAVASNTDPLCWDEFQLVFEDMIEKARSLLTRMHTTKPNTTKSVRVSFTPSVSDPLYFIAATCRNFMTRREAITLLEQCPRSEGTWDITLVLAIAKARIRLEENAVSTQNSHPWCRCVRGTLVCAGHRVTDLKVEIVERARANVTLKTADDITQGRTGTLVSIHW